MKIGINPYLFFDGRCREAFEQYARVMGGEIVMMMPYGDAPGESNAPANWRDKIMHASLKVGDQVIMGGDAPPGHQKTPQGVATSLTVHNAADAERLFAGLVEGGSAYMPLSETFFAERFGMLTDRYGMMWMVNFPGAVQARNAETARDKPAPATPAAKPGKAAR